MLQNLLSCSILVDIATRFIFKKDEMQIDNFNFKKEAKKIMIYFISDFHFGHAKVIEYTDRPFANVEDMNQHMIDRFNSIVKNEDTVYIVGDFCLGNLERVTEYLSKLNGVKHLIRGNHDAGSDDNLIRAGFASVTNSLILTQDGVKIGLSHYPFKRPGEMPGKYNLKPEDCDVLVHGHVHQLFKTKRHESGKLMINVSVEVIKYTPISLNEVLTIYREASEN